MPLYECVLIGRSEITQQQVDTIADTITAQVEAAGATVRKREYWGLRSLAYRVKKNRKGHYMLLGLDIKPADLNEMERQLFLNGASAATDFVIAKAAAGGLLHPNAVV